MILHARDGGRGERVVVCSPAARQSGVRAGMPLAEAAAVATSSLACQPVRAKTPRKAHKLAACGYDPAADREALEALAA